MNILHIDSSILGESSVSKKLSAALVERLHAGDRRVRITYHDLGAHPLAHLSGMALAAQAKPDEERTPEERRAVLDSERTLKEFMTADVVVIGAPMYNFSVPSQLKAWIDRIAVAGKTFRYTEAGPQGLAGGKKVYVLSSRGGAYADTPLAALDYQESYLKAVFHFLGIDDVEVIRAEGVAMGFERRGQAVAQALAQIGAGSQDIMAVA